ncbi:hypothetical protein BGZ72_008834, partial [Mortierella alpina]
AEGDADKGKGELLSVVGETAPEEVEELLRWRPEDELREAIGNAPVSTVGGLDKLFDEQGGGRGAEEEGVTGGGGEDEDKDGFASGGRGDEDSSEGSVDENSDENEKESGEDGRRTRDGGSLERTASATDKEEERSARSAEEWKAGEEEEKEEGEEEEKDDDEEEFKEEEVEDEKGKGEVEKDGNKKEDRAEEVEDGLQVEIDSAGMRWETGPADDEVVCTMTGSMAVPRTARGLAGEKGGLPADMEGSSSVATRAGPGGGAVTHKQVVVPVVQLLVVGAALSFLLSASEDRNGQE